MDEIGKNGIFIAENKETQQLKLFVYGPINHPENYSDIFFDLNILSERYPIVEVVINTPGGDMDSLEELLNALDKFEHVITIARGTVASAGFVLWARGDTRVVGKYSKFMAHRESSTMGGIHKTGESLHYLEVINKLYSEMYEEYLSDILTEEEMTKAQTTEVWLSYKEMLERDVCIDEDTFASIGNNVKEDHIVTVGETSYMFNPGIGAWLKCTCEIDIENPEVIPSIIRKIHEIPVVEEPDEEELIDPESLDVHEELKEGTEVIDEGLFSKEVIEELAKIADEEDFDEEELLEAIEDIIEEAADNLDSEEQDVEEDAEVIEELIAEEDDILEDPVLMQIAQGVIYNMRLMEIEKARKEAVLSATRAGKSDPIKIVRHDPDYLFATIEYEGREFSAEWTSKDDKIILEEIVVSKTLSEELTESKRILALSEEEYAEEYAKAVGNPPKSAIRIEGEKILDKLSEVPEDVLGDVSELRDKVADSLHEIYKTKKEAEDKKEDEVVDIDDSERDFAKYDYWD